MRIIWKLCNVVHIMGINNIVEKIHQYGGVIKQLKTTYKKL